MAERNPAVKKLWIASAASTAIDTCMIWPWSLNTSGYAQINYNGCKVKVGHVVLMLAGKSRPASPNDHMLHSCDVRACCNINHLSWGSNTENVRQSVERGRRSSGNKIKTHCKRGHEFTSDNTHITTTGARQCRKCHADLERERRAAMRELS